MITHENLEAGVPPRLSAVAQVQSFLLAVPNPNVGANHW
jgi:hypothetical protein